MGSESSDDSPIGAPQENINEFWDNLITKKPTKVTKIFPPSLYANLLPPQRKLGTVTGKNAAESYKAAAAECRARVKRIVKECIRTNEKFTDPDFDIEDLSDKNCLEGLMFWYKEQATTTPAVSASQLGRALSTLVQSGVFMGDGAAFDFSTTAKLLSYKSSRNTIDSPRSVHRIDWIFEKPEFVIDGFSSSDLKQGSSGDCWFIAAAATICSNPALMDKVCVARDEECGVYGFVFYRDGEWIWTVVDDNLYLSQSDFDAEWGDRYDPTNAKETKYKKNYQTNSEALYFASCVNENETWLPLLEKAYAKVHGDYDAIAGGWSGEAVEDLTGGVTTKVMTNRVLSKEKLWKELLQVGKKFLFSASSPSSSVYGEDSDARRGLALSHAYSVLRAVEEQDQEGNKYRLVQIRNPWGRRKTARVGEWTGPWSDGSSEWTSYWLDKLNYKFEDDGLFWMSYDEMLKRFDLLDRTRIFDEQWTVVQRWTSVSVAWVTGYLNVKFSVEIKKAGPTVFVLCQLDERYFQGLEGKYEFDLHFILQEKGAAAGDHLVRARGPWFGNRSISAEVDLEVGVYEVLPKIAATRDADVPDVQEVVTKLAERNPQKLRQIGINYDIANAKGVFEQTEEERKRKEQKRKEAAEKKAKEKEAEENAKADFEAWKKEEKAEYEVWKRKRERREKERSARPSEDVKDSETTTTTTTASIDDTTNEKDVSSSSSSPSTPEENKTQNNTADLALRTADPERHTTATTTANDTPPLHSPTTPDSTAYTPATSEASEYTTNTNTNTPDSDSNPSRPSPSPPPPPPPPPHIYRANGPIPPPAPPQYNTPASNAAAKEEPKPWNAVCVIGLRVYSFDPEVSIQFLKPKGVEEAAVLAVDGDVAAAGVVGS